MIVYVILFLVWSKGMPHLIDGAFPDRFNCQAAEGELATMLNADKTVSGWSIVGEPCLGVDQVTKS